MKNLSILFIAAWICAVFPAYYPFRKMDDARRILWPLLILGFVAVGLFYLNRAFPADTELGAVKISWPTPAPIVAGTPLSSKQLNATASARGTFSYNPQPGASLAPGTYTLTAHFVPEDSSKFETEEASTTLLVEPNNTRSNLVRSYVQFEGMPLFVGSSAPPIENTKFSVGDPLAFNIHYGVSGPNPVTLLSVAMGTEIANHVLTENQGYDQKVVDAAIYEFLAEIKKEQHKIKPASHSISQTLMAGDHRFNTAFSWTDKSYTTHRLVTQRDLDDVKSGDETWIAISILTYSDAGNVHHARQCMWLDAPGDTHGVWHDCGGAFPDSD
jgi:hypothetical protein